MTALPSLKNARLITEWIKTVCPKQPALVMDLVRSDRTIYRIFAYWDRAISFIARKSDTFPESRSSALLWSCLENMAKRVPHDTPAQHEESPPLRSPVRESTAGDVVDWDSRPYLSLIHI